MISAFVAAIPSWILCSKFICCHCFSNLVHQLIYFNYNRGSDMSWEGRRDGSGGSRDNEVHLDTWILCSNSICCRFFSNLVHQLPDLFQLLQTIKSASGKEERQGRDGIVHSKGKIYNPLQQANVRWHNVRWQIRFGRSGGKAATRGGWWRGEGSNARRTTQGGQ